MDVPCHPQIDGILSSCATSKVQRAMFSATMPEVRVSVCMLRVSLRPRPVLTRDVSPWAGH